MGDNVFNTFWWIFSNQRTFVMGELNEFKLKCRLSANDTIVNKCKREQPKEKSRMDYPKTLAKLGT